MRGIPKISVCIPAYNAPTFFRKMIQSVVVQDYADFEIIVTDDSTDDCIREILAEVVCPVPLVYEKNHEKLGAPANWNRAISLAKGEYIKILHHDDWFLTPQSLGKFAAIMEKNPEAVMGFSAAEAYDQGQLLKFIHQPPSVKVEALKSDPNILFLGNLVGPPSSVIYKNIPGLRFDENLKWLVDVEFYIRLLHGNQFTFSALPLVGVTVDCPHQVTREFEKRNQLELFEYLYVFSKMAHRTHRIVAYWGVFTTLFKKFSIKSSRDLATVAPDITIPWYLKLLASLPR